jgi:N-acetylmuramoyl-L-alanine amidase
MFVIVRCFLLLLLIGIYTPLSATTLTVNCQTQVAGSVASSLIRLSANNQFTSFKYSNTNNTLIISVKQPQMQKSNIDLINACSNSAVFNTVEAIETLTGYNVVFTINTKTQIKSITADTAKKNIRIIAAGNTVKQVERDVIGELLLQKESVPIKRQQEKSIDVPIQNEMQNVLLESVAKGGIAATPIGEVAFIASTANKILDIINQNNNKNSVKKSSSLRKNIILDAGHGGIDAGESVSNVSEKEVNLSFVLLLKSKLEKMGFNVILTRTGDYYSVENKKVMIAEMNSSDIFLAVHATKSSVQKPQLSVFSPYYDGDNSNMSLKIKKASIIFANHLRLSLQKRKISSISATCSMPISLTSINSATAMIVFGFSDNQDSNAEYQDRLTDIVAISIEQYFST